LRILDKNYPNSKYANGAGTDKKAWWRMW
jgi:hypothetical protein